MHFSFSICLSIGMFAFIPIAGLVVLLPSELFDYLANKLSAMSFPLPVGLISRKIIMKLFLLFHKPEPKLDPFDAENIDILSLFCYLFFHTRAKIKTRWIKKSIINSIGLFCFIWSLSWCLASTNDFSFYPPLYDVGTGLHFDQDWSMFAPNPPFFDYYFSIIANINNTKMDLFRNFGDFTWKGEIYSPVPTNSLKKDHVSHRWSKYFESMISHPNRNFILERFLEYVCIEWNRANNNLYKDNVLYFSVSMRNFTQPFHYTAPATEFFRTFQIAQANCTKSIEKYK